VVALKPVWMVRFFSGVLMFAGITSFLFNMMATIAGTRGTQPQPAAAAAAA